MVFVWSFRHPPLPIRVVTIKYGSGQEIVWSMLRLMHILPAFPCLCIGHLCNKQLGPLMLLFILAQFKSPDRTAVLAYVLNISRQTINACARWARIIPWHSYLFRTKHVHFIGWLCVMYDTFTTIIRIRIIPQFGWLVRDARACVFKLNIWGLTSSIQYLPHKIHQVTVR